VNERAIYEKYATLSSPHQQIEVITIVTLVIIVSIFGTVHYCYDASYNYCYRLLYFGGAQVEYPKMYYHKSIYGPK
jgi:hypothetical protein